MTKRPNLVLNKTTGRIHDVPDNHYSLSPGKWPRGRNWNEATGEIEEGFAEEYEILNPDEYEFTMEAGWQKRVPSASRSTPTKNERRSSKQPSTT